MATIPDPLIWEIMKKNNAFLVKLFGNGNAKVQFSKEPNNLYNVNSFTYSGLANKKTVSIQAAGDKELSIVLSMAKTKKQNKPGSLNHRSVMKKEFRQMDKAVKNQNGWIYGSVIEDILTGFKMHCRGWRSIYYMPLSPAFKGSAPINLSDRLHQVLRWALGSIEIFLSRHCPL